MLIRHAGEPTLQVLLAAFQREFAKQNKKNKKVTKEIDFIWRTVE